MARRAKRISIDLDFALKKLARLELDQRFTNSVHAQRYNLRMDLRFLTMFCWCYGKWDYTGNRDGLLGSFMSRMDVACRASENWETFANQLQEKVEHLKPEIKEICLDLLDRSVLRCKSSTSDEIYDFTVTIYRNLKDFLGLKAHMIVPVKKQIEALQEKLKLFGNLVKFTAERRICHDEELRDFMVQVQAWTIKVAALSFLHWADQWEEETVRKLVTRYPDVLQQIKPCSPEAIRKFLGVLKASKSSLSDTFLMGELVASSVDMLLEDPMASMEDSFRTPLRDELIILITFLMDPPTECENDGNQIWAKADVVIDEAASLISSLCVREEKEGIPNERDFLEKLDILKAEIRENFVQIQQWSDFPRTNGLGFVDFLLGHLKEMATSIPFAKCLVLAMKEKLISLRPYLEDLMEQQNGSKELKDLWMRIIRVAYAVEHVVDSCSFGDYQIWYKMICLSVVLEEIEFVMTEVEKIRVEYLYCSRLSAEMNSNQAMPECSKTLRIAEVVVGFKKEAEAIINQVTRGSQELQIVSIVGMPGQGKTTLANKVYNDPSIICHFHKLAWCSVSQVYRTKQLLLDILSDVTVLDDKIRQMSEAELVEKLYKCLKGQRYLIVMDDIWDIEAWHQLKESFPNDSYGSRIIFTSRIHGITSQVKLGSSTHLLHPLSTEESWDLLQKKLFDKDGCPANLSEVGLQIVEICEGLPLSIVVTSGVLERRVKNLNWWKEVAANLSSRILNEGNIMILEISYRNLPDILKPCFLYFGGFQRGQVIKVQKLTQLWVAEGFIPKNGAKRLEDVAKDFLMDLIGRSLVIVVKSSCDAGIKKCRVHDLLFDFCLTKAEEEKFLKPLKDMQYPSKMRYEQYRLSIHSEWEPFVESNPTPLYARSLLVHQHGYLNLHPNDPSFFMKFKFLRVLDLEYGVYFDGFPEEIISLIHLRYLAIQGIQFPRATRDVLFLPPDIENLQNLEVLCVRGTKIIHVPATIWKMKRLRHICFRGSSVFSFGVYVHQDAQLENVDTLSCPFVGCNEYGEELLRRFPNVRKSKFLLGTSQFPVLDFLNNLESLNMLCCHGLYHPCEFKFPSTLKKLTLSRSGLPWSEISAIGKLPNLEVLKLLERAFVGNSWYMEDEEFLNLKFLKLQFSDIEQWNACSDPFPSLQRLVLEGCGRLQEIPSNFGDISTLNLIEVRGCSKGARSSAKEILNEQQQEMGNYGFEVLIKSFDFDTHDGDGEWSDSEKCFLADGLWKFSKCSPDYSEGML